MSLMMACTSIAPMLAPLIGGQILWFLGWRAIRMCLDEPELFKVQLRALLRRPGPHG